LLGASVSQTFPPTPTPTPPKKLSTGAIIGIVIGSVAGALLIGLLLFAIIAKKWCFASETIAPPRESTEDLLS
jgi:hypothetical protein